jgi:hypothetical protein
LDIRKKTLPDNRLIGLTLSWLGGAYFNLGQIREAIPRLEEAGKLLESARPSLLAANSFMLARALWDTHSDRERAITLAQQARAIWLRGGQARRKEVKEVDGWLSSKRKLQADSSVRAAKQGNL